MTKKYREIEFGLGHINSAIKELKSHDDLVCGDFNGKTIYSDETIDQIYKKVTGKTKSEFDEAQKKWHEDYEAEKKKHEEAIPQLTKEWIEKGEKVLDKKYHDLWKECVPIRLNDLYRGMELKATLDIVEKLNGNCDLDEAKDLINNQGHSGMSYSLVCAMVKSFSNRGIEFVNHLK